jgi:hypothetical protein
MTEMTRRRAGDGRNLRPLSDGSAATVEDAQGESRLRLAPE